MSAITTVPVAVAPEAAARVAELGYQREFEQLIELARSMIQGLRFIDVKLEPGYDTDEEDQVVLWLRIANDQLLDNPSVEEYRRRTSETFSRDVIRYLSTIATVSGSDQ